MATSQASVSASFKTILFATDFSFSSEAALPYLMSLGRAFDSTIIAVHAVPYEPLAGLGAVPPMPEFDSEWRDALQAMRAYEQTHPFTGLQHEFMLERGFFRDVVTDLVARKAVDLVVLGTHGRQGFHKIFGGSQAEEVLRSIGCPVLTVGPGVTVSTGENWKPTSIVFATEFAEGSMHALRYALALADANEAALLVMHAVPLVPYELQAEVYEKYQQRLHKLISDDLPHRCRVDYSVHFDLAAPGILTAADDVDANLIVMGVHHARLPRLDAHVPGTTVSDVVSNARCPVLTVCG